MNPIALITGITGQDGSYLAERLLQRGYEVHGIVRPGSNESRHRISHIEGNLALHAGDLRHQSEITQLVKWIHPQEIYNLAAQTFVPASWERPVETCESTAMGVLYLLEAIRATDPTIRVFQASSSEMFGAADTSPQDESSEFRPRNPYAASKVYSHWMVKNYRVEHNLFATSGILFNHESPRRGLGFVTRKITRTAAMIKLGLADELRLGNLESRRDWGFAGDYVDAMWAMLHCDEPDDFVIGTGTARRVGDFVEAAFARVDLDWRDYVVIDPAYFRPTENVVLQANPSKAQDVLGWQPQVTFEELVEMMVDADLLALTEQQRSQRQQMSAATMARKTA